MENAFTFSLNKGSVKSLRKLVDQYEKTGAPVHLKSLDITNSQYTNFCHLTYFNLVQHVGKGWIPTEDGIMFIYGKIEVVSPQAVMNGQVLPEEHEAWTTHSQFRERVSVNDIDSGAYKQHDEYAEEIDIPVTL